MSTRRILSVKRIKEEFDLISFEDGGYLYERHTPNRWRFIISALGGSAELVRDDTELEEAYQQWLQEEKGKEKAMNEQREGKMTVPPEEMRRPKHFAIMDTLANLQRMVSNLEDLSREVERGERTKGTTEIIDRGSGDEKVSAVLEGPDLLPLSHFLFETPGRIELMADSIAKSTEGLREMLF